MGQLYSHLVFRPPQVCTYQAVNGTIKYVVPGDDGLPTVHATDLVWLLNRMGFRIPCAIIKQPAADYVAIYAHQNGEDLGTSVRDAHLLSHALNIDVLAFEYSGYGLSEKPPRSQYHSSRAVHAHAVAPSLLEEDRQRAEPSEKACCSDIIAAYSYLTDQCDVHPTKILIFGRSIGSGPAVYCAATRPVGGLVLIAPIASAVRVPLKRLNVTLPFIDTFPNIDRASKVQCPVLVVHGEMDDLVPKLHAEKLFAKIRQTGNAVNPLWIPTARHNNVVEDFHSIVFGRYLTFLDELKAMTADRRSIEQQGFSRGSRARASQSAKLASPVIAPAPRRPRWLPVPTCFRAPRTSIDNLSTRAKASESNVYEHGSSASPSPASFVPSQPYGEAAVRSGFRPSRVAHDATAGEPPPGSLYGSGGGGAHRMSAHGDGGADDDMAGFVSEEDEVASDIEYVLADPDEDVDVPYAQSRSRLTFPFLRTCLRTPDDSPTSVIARAARKATQHTFHNEPPVPVTLQVNPSWQALRESIESQGRIAPT